MILANVRHLARTRHQAAARPRRSRSSPTRRPAASRAATTSSTTTPSSSRASPRRSARSAATASPCPPRTAASPPAPTCCRPPRRASLWLRLRAHGRAGHGSVPNDENAIVRLAEAIARIDAHVWPREYIASVRELLDGLSELTGIAYSDEDADDLLGHLGGAQGFVRGTLQDTANFTMLTAGYKHNVIPQTRHGRRWTAGSCPATRTSCWPPSASSRASTSRSRSCTATSRSTRRSSGPLVEAMKAALLAEDPGRRGPAVLPVRRHRQQGAEPRSASPATGSRRCGCRPTSTSRPMFHGIDERVPVDALEFGARVLQRLIATC